MTCGYFGKLPARADFISRDLPAGFLRLWEGFVEAGLRQSRQDLNGAWEEAYMTMPVWRFWLVPHGGVPLFGAPVAGAMMPSVDRVGRAYPLTVAQDVASGQRPGTSWYDTTERVLRGALDEDADLEGFQSAVSGLPAPGIESGDLAATSDDGGPETTLRLVPDERSGARLETDFWCRIGADTVHLTSEGMPSAVAFRHFLKPEAVLTADRLGDRAETRHGRSYPEDHQT